MAGYTATNWPSYSDSDITIGDTRQTTLQNMWTPSGLHVTYRMRGFDANVAVNDWVYWLSTIIDSTASEYTGSAGPVTKIVVLEQIYSVPA